MGKLQVRFCEGPNSNEIFLIGNKSYGSTQQNNDTIPFQGNKPTYKHSLKWIFE